MTEGDGEFKSLPFLYAQISRSIPGKVLIAKPLRVHTTPDAPVGQIVAACRAPLQLAAGGGASLIVLLIDREKRTTRPGEIAKELESALAKKVDVEVRVAIKDRMFENWLIADLGALRAQPGRFNVSPALAKRVEPNKADMLSAGAEIKRIIVGSGQYEKVKDGERICKRADVDVMARHSRSFRHFLHVLGHELYRDQCARPVAL
ncbi:MAG: DUF4276 family protein [Rhodococcus sp.]|nr:DUF4276 family protein [Rhodococcus sp. (in: high G+C Gram-positive bacteria)]